LPGVSLQNNTPACVDLYYEHGIYKALKKITRKAPRIIKARHTGFCFGVKRAIAVAKGLLRKNKKACSLGPIIHNPFVVESLSEKGLKVISDIKEARGACMVIRSHGIPPALMKKAQEYCAEIFDATCPFVSRSHKIVSRLRKEGYLIAIAGKRRHPEVQALIERAGPGTLVITDKSDIKRIAPGKVKLALIAQTTISRDIFAEIAEALLRLDYPEYRIFDTICSDVAGRQKEAKALAARAGVVCVVGGKNSSNTRYLAEICKNAGALTYHIESADELRSEWFKKAVSIGIVSGASTPGDMVEQVVKKIKKYNLTRRNRYNAGK
jgi:(E)-4-hydroxy-3-methyl-but-2-enyl pyrophosphate reductase